MSSLDALDAARKERLLVLAVWIGSCVVVFAAASLDITGGERSYRAIKKDPATAVAHWTLKNCANHASRQYTFFVDGAAYRGGHGGSEGGNCESVQLGAPVNVVYERENPANNFAGKPEDIDSLIGGARLGYVFALLWPALTYVFLVRPRLKRPAAG